VEDSITHSFIVDDIEFIIWKHGGNACDAIADMQAFISEISTKVQEDLMILSNEVLVALISVSSTLLVIAIKDVALGIRLERRRSQRSLLKDRIEQAYAPLEYAIFTYLRSDDVTLKLQLARDINDILRTRSYLLSEQTTSALYVLLEDENAGANLLQTHFAGEYAALKEAYYRMWYTPRLHYTYPDREQLPRTNMASARG